MSDERWKPRHEFDSIRVEGLFEPPTFEAFDLYHRGNRHSPFAVALVRWSSGERVKAWCIDGGCPESKLSEVKALDGRFRFTGPIISYHEPEDKGVVMAHVQDPSGHDVFIIREGFDDRCGIYDLHMNPFDSYIDTDDEAVRKEALHHTQERNELRIGLQAAVQEIDLLGLLLQSNIQDVAKAHAQIDRLERELNELKARGGVNDQKQLDLLILGLGGVGFEQLSVIDRRELLAAVEKELYRVLHPDRFTGLGRDTGALQTTVTMIIQQKIAAIERLKRK